MSVEQLQPKQLAQGVRESVVSARDLPCLPQGEFIISLDSSSKNGESTKPLFNESTFQETLGIFEAIKPALSYKLSLMRLGEADIEDVLQDACITAVLHDGQYDSKKGKKSSWCFQIAINKAKDLKKKSYMKNHDSYDEDETIHAKLASQEIVSEESVWQESIRTSFREALDSLPEGQRKALELRYYYEMSDTQIAEYLGVPLGTIKGRLRDGTKKVRKDKTLQSLYKDIDG